MEHSDVFIRAILEDGMQSMVQGFHPARLCVVINHVQHPTWSP